MSAKWEVIWDDIQAIRLLKQGNLYGLEVLVQRYQVKAVRVAFLITHDHALAEDVVHTVFIRVYERIVQFDDKRAFEPWLMRSIVNAALKAVKRQQRFVSFNQPKANDGLSLEDLLESQDFNPEDAVERSELKQLVQQALLRLPPEQRAVVVMKYYLDLNETQISQQTAIPKGTIRWRLHTARKSLRGFLSALSHEI